MKYQAAISGPGGHDHLGPVRANRADAVADGDRLADEYGVDFRIDELPEETPERPEPRTFTRRPLEQLMLDVLDYVIEAGGEVEDEPGRLLHRIADDLGADYYAVAPAVRRLEDVGFVQVERSVDPQPRQSNRVCRIAIV